MKKLVGLICVLALAIVISPATAGLTVKLTEGPSGIWGHHDGFTVTDVSGSLGSWHSFCLERNEGVEKNVKFDATLDTAAINGGFGGGNPDPLDFKTAYLYSKFRNGSLAGFDGTDNAYVGLQQAIWSIENEPTVKNTYANTFLADAAGSGWTSIGNVRVLNLWGAQGEPKQSQLITVPAPGALILGSIGISLVGWLRRRRSL